MADLVQHPVVQALAWALVHFVWQGALIALIAFLSLRAVRSSSARYLIGVGALAVMMAAPVATFATMLSQQPALVETAGANVSPARTVPDALALTVSTQPGAELTVAGTNAGMILAAAVAMWMVGVVCFSIRLFGGWVVARRMTRRAVQPASAQIQELARKLATRLNVSRVVSVMQSSAVVVPVMVGWLKPTVILPVAALAGLSPTQLEALLAHELAHVRRHDYLVNLLQSVAEALLFYHPAVWWLSARVRAERELCCDDLAVGVCDRLAYATALSELAAMASPRVALAATDGDLLHRVKRILEQGGDMSTRRVSGIPLLILVLAAGIAAPAALAATQTRAPRPGVKPVAIVSEAPSVRLERQASESVALEQEIGLAIEQPSGVQSSAQQQAYEQRILELRRALEDLQKQLAEIEGQRGDVARRAEETRARANNQNEAAVRLEQIARETESQASRKRLDEIKYHYAKGLATEQQVKNAQAAVARSQARGNPEELLKLDAEKMKDQVARSESLVQKGLMSQRDLAAQQDALRQILRQLEVVNASGDPRQLLEAYQQQSDYYKKLAEVRERPKEVAPEAQLKELADRQKLAERERAELANKMSDAQARSADAARRSADERLRANVPIREIEANQNEPVKPGDVLRITIEGEPDLPSSYQVREDGTIRMPFVGSIKVAGMPSANVRAAVGKQLSERKLGSANQVSVVLLRSGRGAR